jgi:hypothetical protein
MEQEAKTALARYDMVPMYMSAAGYSSLHRTPSRKHWWKNWVWPPDPEG